METEKCCGEKNFPEWDLELERRPLHYEVSKLYNINEGAFFLFLKGAWEGRPPILKEIQVLNLNNGRQLFVCELEIKPQGRGQGGGECSKSLENIFFSSKKTR